LKAILIRINPQQILRSRYYSTLNDSKMVQDRAIVTVAYPTLTGFVMVIKLLEYTLHSHDVHAEVSEDRRRVAAERMTDE